MSFLQSGLEKESFEPRSLCILDRFARRRNRRLAIVPQGCCVWGATRPASKLMSFSDRYLGFSRSLTPLARDAAARTLAALRFYSRLPLPIFAFEQTPFAMPDMARLAPYAPVAGAIIGACGALVLAIARALGLPFLLSAALALSALVLIGGAFHEDGLADVADGFGGGATRERKLEIMRDSRIGAFGGAALILSLLLRAAALAALVGEGTRIAVMALVVGGALSRAYGLAPIALLDPARFDGAGASVGRLQARAFSRSLAAALAIVFVVSFGGLGFGRTLLAGILAAVAALAMTEIARRQIGGQTGDVAGAAQQLAEIAFLCGLLIGADVA
jgi:adenosylcobinamide-GDP ribazoletransferase